MRRGGTEMTSADLLTDSFGRIDEVVGEVLDGLTVAELTSRLDDGANSIAWLIWHLTRVQDDHIAAVADAELLGSYHDAVQQNTLRFVQQVTDADLERVVDERWDPPVTLGVRLISVIADDLQHVGQAAYIRGILERRR